MIVQALKSHITSHISEPSLVRVVVNIFSIEMNTKFSEHQGIDKIKAVTAVLIQVALVAS